MSNRIQACPIILEKGVPNWGRKPDDRFVPVYLGGHRHGQHIEEVQTVGDLFDSMNVEDNYRLNRDDFIIWKHQVKNVFCGGEALMAIGIARKEIIRGNTFQNSTFSVYVSLTEDGRLVTAIPG